MTFSKHVARATCADIMHPWTDNCFHAHRTMFGSSIVGSCKLFLPIILVSYTHPVRPSYIDIDRQLQLRTQDLQVKKPFPRKNTVETKLKKITLKVKITFKACVAYTILSPKTAYYTFNNSIMYKLLFPRLNFTRVL